MKKLIALTAISAFAITACNFSGERTDKTEQDEAQEAIEQSDVADITPVDKQSIRAEGVVANGIVVADFDALELGPKIYGPVGPEVQASLATPLASMADIESWVTCPAPAAGTDGEDGDEAPVACEPGNMPAGTVYTYVHAITPGVDRPNDRPFKQPEAVGNPTEVTAFRVAVPLEGFTGKAGYSFGDVSGALANNAKIAVACLDKVIVFSIDGDPTSWRKGRTIRFFWQTTAAPAGPAARYELAVDGRRAVGSGPAPAQPEGSEGPAPNVPCA